MTETGKSTATMTIKESIFDRMRQDFSLVKKIADDLDLREGTVTKWAYRKQHAKVGHYAVVNIIKKHTGLTDSEIFETETENVTNA